MARTCITTTRPVLLLLSLALLFATSTAQHQQLRGLKKGHKKKDAPPPPPPQTEPVAPPKLARGAPLHFLPVKADYVMPRVSYDFHQELNATWGGLKARTIDPYEVKLLHRPRSEAPGDAVSEGVGYGMLVALYSNEQAYFSTLLDNAEKYMWQGSYHNWRMDEMGNRMDGGAATDAEQDIALCLIFGQHLVDQGVWAPHTTPQGATYGQRAQQILDGMWTAGLIQDSKYVAPGSWWGGPDFVNPGYFSPAWYRVFKAFDAKAAERNYDSVIDQCYESILSSVGVSNGLLPDWMTPQGQFLTQSLGYNAYLDGRGFFKDAIRTHWRLATDYAWNQEPRALEFLSKAYAFLEAKGGAPAANFFTMDGEVVPKGDTWLFNGGQTTRHRYEHSHLTVGMWATTAYAAKGAEGAEPYATELRKFYEGGDYWGNKVDPTGQQEDIDHNELYFDQFLAWFGASLISGYFVDVTKAV